MIRIANMSNDQKSTATRATYLVRLLPAWLLSGDYKASQSCVMTDLSSGGAAVLIPISQVTRAESFDLVFISPDNEDEILTILPAEQRWRDEEHSPDHIKIGVVFPDMDLIKTQMINAMIQLINQKKFISEKFLPNTTVSMAVNA